MGWLPAVCTVCALISFASGMRFFASAHIAKADVPCQSMHAIPAGWITRMHALPRGCMHHPAAGGMYIYCGTKRLNSLQPRTICH